MKLIVDASVAIKWFVPEPDTPRAESLLERDETIYAPDFLFTEITNILWKKVLRGEVRAAQAQNVILTASSLIDEISPTTPLLGSALLLSITLRHPVYDCIYLACAEDQGGRVVTVDGRFLRALSDTPHQALVVHLDHL